MNRRKVMLFSLIPLTATTSALTTSMLLRPLLVQTTKPSPAPNPEAKFYGPWYLLYNRQCIRIDTDLKTFEQRLNPNTSSTMQLTPDGNDVTRVTFTTPDGRSYTLYHFAKDCHDKAERIDPERNVE